jgi:toxin-antitoxin system PIN domain toxin
MTTYLLDVNMLLALCDTSHAQHEAAHRWLAKHGSKSWATCPITENGFIRVASHPNYPNSPGGVNAIVAILREFCARVGHEFWADDVSLREGLVKGLVLTPTQVTDVYLLMLAVKHEGKLATFDKSIQTKLVQGGAAALEVISQGS